METQGLGVTNEEGVSAAEVARANVFGHVAFSGTYRTKLEPNGRVVVPSALRGPLVTAGQINLWARPTCIFLFTPLGFDRFVDDVMAKQATGVASPVARLDFYKASPKISVDKQGRLVVPPELRAAVGMDPESEVVLSGAIERIELWPAGPYDDAHRSTVDLLNLMIDGHAGLPTGTAGHTTGTA